MISAPHKLSDLQNESCVNIDDLWALCDDWLLRADLTGYIGEAYAFRMAADELSELIGPRAFA